MTTFTIRLSDTRNDEPLGMMEGFATREYAEKAAKDLVRQMNTYGHEMTRGFVTYEVEQATA